MNKLQACAAKHAEKARDMMLFVDRAEVEILKRHEDPMLALQDGTNGTTLAHNRNVDYAIKQANAYAMISLAMTGCAIGDALVELLQLALPALRAQAAELDQAEGGGV